VLIVFDYTDRLYIPHSSDKTSSAMPPISSTYSFTSHIVQIKPINSPFRISPSHPFTSHIVQIKLALELLKEKELELYIPHSSDKTLQCLLFLTTQTDFTSHIVQIKQALPCLP